MTFAAEGLPKGLKLDAETGIITGQVKKAGTYYVTMKATNALGTAERPLRIVIGEDICLTPPLGWNSWNVWGNRVTQEQVLSSARAMVESGMSKREVLRASRGRLLDRNGELLAGNAEYSFRAGGANGKRTAREMRRIHPWQSVGAVVLGNVNRDGVGTSGLEQMFNDSLRGVDG